MWVIQIILWLKEDLTFSTQRRAFFAIINNELLQFMSTEVKEKAKECKRQSQDA